MEKNEIELLHNELITTDRLEEIELSECVKSVADLGQSVFHDTAWHSVEFVDGDSVDVYVLENKPLDINLDKEPNQEKVEELLGMGEVFKELNGIIDWHYVTDNNKIEIYTTTGVYHAEKMHGTWGFLKEINTFVM